MGRCFIERDDNSTELFYSCKSLNGVMGEETYRNDKILEQQCIKNTESVSAKANELVNLMPELMEQFVGH